MVAMLRGSSRRDSPLASLGYGTRLYAPSRMNAAKLKFMYGDLLIGREIMTIPYGEWPGGRAEIIQISPDPEGAPEIVFQVRHETELDPETGKLWEIGVFEHEPVSLIGPEPRLNASGSHFEAPEGSPSPPKQ